MDKRQFIEFLKNYRNLEVLDLSNSSLSQYFINILPVLLPNLNRLIIQDEETIFNFKPILKLKNLSYFYINQNLEDLDFLYNLFKKTKITSLQFFYRDQGLVLTSERGNYFIDILGKGVAVFIPKDENFFLMFKEFEESNLSFFSEVKSDKEIKADYGSDDKSIYKLTEIRSIDSNVIN